MRTPRFHDPSKARSTCPQCKKGKVFTFPGPTEEDTRGLACTNPECDWIDTIDHDPRYSFESQHTAPDTRRRELAT